MRIDLAEALAQQTYGTSANPEHVDNKDCQDFQDGYVVGMGTDSFDKEGLHPITKEYQRRGCPEDAEGLASFKDWKRGYWAGIFKHIQQ